MTHLLRLEPKWIVVLDDSDTEIMVDRQHFEDLVGLRSMVYWHYWEFNDSIFRSDMSRYLSQHHTLNTIEGLKIELS